MRLNQSKKALWAAVIVMLILLLTAVFGGRSMAKRSRTVGKDIAFADITEFYFTRTASTYPPDYQRYHFSVTDGTYLFYHETRDGNAFPLTEQHITLSGTVELTAAQWDAFLAFLNGGSVSKRSESAAGGSSGPSLYLYWIGDRGTYQMFSFPSRDAAAAFESFCEALRAEQ